LTLLTGTVPGTYLLVKLLRIGPTYVIYQVTSIATVRSSHTSLPEAGLGPTWYCKYTANLRQQ